MNQSATYAIQNSRFKIQNLLAVLFWLVTGLAVTLPVLRFGLRYVGVRPDTPFPSFIYSLTAPFVTPFYGLFPVSERFDYYAVEWASLVAAGCVLIGALVLYGVALLVAGLGRRSADRDEVSASQT